VDCGRRFESASEQHRLEFVTLIRVDAPTFHSEAEAEAEARRRNQSLVDAGKGYSDFWVEKRLPKGQWRVEYCRVRIPWYRRLLRGIWASFSG
jgi:hypothetical protein